MINVLFVHCSHNVSFIECIQNLESLAFEHESYIKYDMVES